MNIINNLSNKAPSTDSERGEEELIQQTEANPKNFGGVSFFSFQVFSAHNHHQSTLLVVQCRVSLYYDWS